MDSSLRVLVYYSKCYILYGIWACVICMIGIYDILGNMILGLEFEECGFGFQA